VSSALQFSTQIKNKLFLATVVCERGLLFSELRRFFAVTCGVGFNYQGCGLLLSGYVQ